MARLTPPKSPMVYDKHHSGCMWGLYSLFEFGQGNSSRKLLSDRKRFKRVISDHRDVRRHNLIAELDAKTRGKDGKNEILGISDTANVKVESNGKARKPSQQPSHANPIGKSSDKKSHSKKKRGCGCKNVDFVKYDQLLKVNDVAEAIVNQKLIEGKYLSRSDGVNKQSKQLLDALEILNSNKDLFTKLLQDPNSLLVKHIQDLRESQEQKQKSVDDDDDDRIVVLKPGKTGLGFEENGQSVRPSYFSFNDIKKKFKHAMGVPRKDRSLMRIDGEKTRGAEEVRRNFQNPKVMGISSFDAQKRDKIEKLREFKARIGQENGSSSESRNYMENIRRQYSETTVSSPERGVKNDFVASQMRYSPYSYNNQAPYDRRRDQKSVKQNEDSVDGEKPDMKLRVSDVDLSSHITTLEADRDARGDSEEATPSERFSGSNGSIKTSSEDTSVDTERANEETEHFKCSEMVDSRDSSVDNQPSSSSSDDVSSTPPSTIDGSKDIGESSPISVLEQYFAEVSSPPLHQPVNPKTETNTYSNVYETISDYVETVLRSSRLNSGDPISKCLESDHELERFCGDCKLLFDCVSEVLVELHGAHLRPVHWLTFFGPMNLRRLETERFVSLEAMKRIACYFDPPPVQWPLDRLIGDDLRRADTWLDIRADGEDVVCEVVGVVLDELVMETMLELSI